MDVRDLASLHGPRRPDAPGWRRLLRGVLLVVVAAALLTPGRGVEQRLLALLPLGSATAPTPQPAAGDAPLGVAPAAPAGGGAHAFLALRPDGSPVSYDPCRLVRYVVNDRTAPPGGDLLLAQAVERLEQLTGLVFEHEGRTDEAPSAQRPAFQPERYGDRWAPILIAWSDPAETPALAGMVAGQAGSSSVQPLGGPEVWVTGEVVLDGQQLAIRLAQHGERGRADVHGVLLHELGHLVGLAHVDDPAQLMHPRTRQTVPQPGDLAGLAALGAGPCVPRL